MSRGRDERTVIADLIRDVEALDDAARRAAECPTTAQSSQDAQLLDLLCAGRTLADVELPHDEAERAWQRLRIAQTAPAEQSRRSLRPLWLGASFLAMSLAMALLIRSFAPAPRQNRTPIQKEQYLRLESGGKTVLFHLIVHE